MISIRKALPEEWHKLQILNDEAFTGNYKYDPDLKRDWAMSETGKKYFQKIVSDSESICFVAEDEGKLVGYVAAIPKKFAYRLSAYLEIDNLGVIPEYRLHGVASQLIAAVKTWAKEQRYDKLFVESYWKNDPAISLYEHSGFNEIDVGLEIAI